MFTTLSVQDFQSIAAADLELAAFTVIVGENRSGKTALLRAIRNLLSNKTGSGFIRRGKSRCVVSLGTLEGDVVVWEKTKSTATYSLNDQPFSKMAGSVPEEIKNALGVREVVVDNTLTLSPQLAMSASDSLFLIDKSPGQAARALAKLTRLDVVVKAQILCKQAIRQLKGELKAVQENIGSTSEEIDEFIDLEERGRIIAKSTPAYQGIMADISRLARLDSELKAFEEAKGVSKHRIPNDPTLGVDIDCLEESVELLDALDIPVPVAIPPVDLSDDIERLSKANGWCMRHATETENVELAEMHYSRLTGEDAALSDAIAAFKGEICPVCGGTL